MFARETIIARGHKNITARHKTTFEFTKDCEISKRADCIIAVGANKATAELSDEFKTLARSNNAIITVDIFAGDTYERISGKGSEMLSFSHPRDVVGRRSGYSCGRTLLVHGDKAWADLNRKLVEKLKVGGEVIIKLLVEVKYMGLDQRRK